MLISAVVVALEQVSRFLWGAGRKVWNMRRGELNAGAGHCNMYIDNGLQFVSYWFSFISSSYCSLLVFVHIK